jgi:hypothetical protein
MAPSTPVAEVTDADVTVIVVGAIPIPASGETVVVGLAPSALARRLESKLDAASGEMVCVTGGRVIVIAAVKTVTEALEVVVDNVSGSGKETLVLVLVLLE